MYGSWSRFLATKRWKSLNLTFPSKLLFCVVWLFLQQSCSSGWFIGERAQIFSNRIQNCYWQWYHQNKISFRKYIAFVMAKHDRSIGIHEHFLTMLENKIKKSKWLLILSWKLLKELVALFGRWSGDWIGLGFACLCNTWCITFWWMSCRYYFRWFHWISDIEMMAMDPQVWKAKRGFRLDFTVSFLNTFL